MSSIDERIVEMQFDNDEFERNINESIQSLEKLKKSLKIEESGDAFRNIQNASKDLDFNHISEGLDALNRRFSTTGIIGMQVLQSLTQAAIQLGGQLINTVTAPIKNDILKGGWTRAMNIEKAKFQLEGLKADVKGIMEDVDNAVSGTAYGLDEAALVASQLAASGIEAGDGIGQMGHALLAVSGMAAMTGREYGEIGHIMTTIAGNGRLMGMQLTQFSTYGLNVAAELSKQLGYTEEQIRDMVSKGLIDFTTFSEAMFAAYAQHAKNANKTLTGSISNVHAALKKIGQDFMNPLVENDGSLVHLVNTIRLAINEIRKLTKPFADNVWTPWIKGTLDGLNAMVDKFALFRDTRPFEEMDSILKGTAISGESVRKMLFNIGKSSEDLSSYKILAPFKTYEDFIKKYGSFENSLKEGWLNSDVIQAAIKALHGETDGLTKGTADLNSEYEQLRDLVASVWRGDWGNGAVRVKKMTDAGLDYAKIQRLVNKCEKGRMLTLEDLDEEMLVNMGLTKKEADAYVELAKKAQDAGVPLMELLERMENNPTILQMVGGTIGNAIGTIIDLFHILADAIKEVFKPASYETLNDFLYGIYDASFGFRLWNEQTKTFTSRGQALKSILKALLTIIKVVVKIVASLATFAVKIVRLLWPIVDVVVTLVGGIAEFVGNILSLIDSIGIVESIFAGLSFVIEPIADAFSKLSGIITNAFTSQISKMATFFTMVKLALAGDTGVSENAQRFAKFLLTIKDVFEKTFEAITKVIEGIINGMTKFYDALKNHPEVERFVNNIERLFNIVSKEVLDRLDKFGTSLGNLFGDDGDLSWVEKLAKFLGDLLKPVNDFLDKIGKDGKIFDNISLSGLNFDSIIKGISDNIVKLLDYLNKFGFEGFSKFFGEFNWNNAIDVASILSFFYMVYTIGIWIKRMPSTNIFSRINGVLFELKRTIADFGTLAIAGSVFALAAAIGGVAAVVYALGEMDRSKLSQGLGALMLISVLLGALATFFKKKKFYRIEIKKGVMKQYATAILEISAAIAIIIFAINNVKEMLKKDWLGTLLALGIIGIILAGLVVAMRSVGELTGKKVNPKNILAIGTVFIALAAVLTIVSITLGLLSLFNPGKVMNAAISMGIVLAVMALILKKLSDPNISGKKMIAAGAALTLMGAAIALLAIPIAALGSIAVVGGWKKALAVAASVAGLIGVMGLIMALLANVPANSETKMLAAGAAMILLSTALILLVPVITALTTLDAMGGSKGLDHAVLIIVEILGLFALFSGVISFFKLEASLLAVGVALLAFGVGCFFTAKAVLTLGMAIPALFAGLALAGQIITQKAPEIITAIVTIIAMIAIAISGSIPNMILIAKSLILAISGGILSALPQIIYVINIMLLAAGAFLVNAIPFLANLLVKIVITLINATGVAIVEHGPDLMRAILNVLMAIFALVEEAILMLVDMCLGWLPGVKEGIDAGMTDIKNRYKDKYMFELDMDKAEQMGEDYTDHVYKGSEKSIEKNKNKNGFERSLGGGTEEPTSTGTPKKRNTGWDPRNTGVDQEAVKQAEEQAKQQAVAEDEAREKAYTDVLEQRKAAQREVKAPTTTVDKETVVEENKEAATEGAKSYWDTFNLEMANGEFDMSKFTANIDMGSFNETMSNMGIDGADTFKFDFISSLGENPLGSGDFESMFDMKSIGNLFKGKGGDSQESYTSGVKEKSASQTQPVIKTEASKWAKAADNKGEWTNVGANNLVGFINGMVSNSGLAVNEAKKIADNVINTVKSTFDQESPSKVFHQIGVYNDQGLINGMLALSGKVNDASADVADGAVNSAQYAMNRIQSVINSDMDIAPTIRPVFDDSLLQNGISSMNAWGNGYALNLAGSIGSVNISQGRIFDDLNNRLDSRFQELSDRMDKFTDQKFDFNLTTTLDGREIAKGTASYTREEINRIDRNGNRRAGRR